MQRQATVSHVVLERWWVHTPPTHTLPNPQPPTTTTAAAHTHTHVYCPGLPVNCDPMAPVLYTGWMHTGKLTFIINPAAWLSFEVFIIHTPLWVFSKPGGCERVRRHNRPFPIMSPPLRLPGQFIFNSLTAKNKNKAADLHLVTCLIHAAAQKEEKRHPCFSFSPPTHMPLSTTHAHTPTCTGFQHCIVQRSDKNVKTNNCKNNNEKRKARVRTINKASPSTSATFCCY